MPFLHRWWCNPMSPDGGSAVSRAHPDGACGLRGLPRALHGRGLRCTGMEFASEMVIKTALSSARISEVPITLRPDQRRTRAPHLRTFRDGWRHLRFYLMYSPRWLFLLPGTLLLLLGALGYALGMPGVRLAGAHSTHARCSPVSRGAGYQSIRSHSHEGLRVRAGRRPSTRHGTLLFGVNLERGPDGRLVITLVGVALWLRPDPGGRELRNDGLSSGRSAQIPAYFHVPGVRHSLRSSPYPRLLAAMIGSGTSGCVRPPHQVLARISPTAAANRRPDVGRAMDCWRGA